MTCVIWSMFGKYKCSAVPGMSVAMVPCQPLVISVLFIHTDIISPLVPSVWWCPWHKSCHVALSTLGRLRLHLHKHPLLLSHPSTQPHSTIQRSEVMKREPENLWWCHQCVWGSLDWARSRKRSIAVIRRRRRAMSLWGPVFQEEKMARVVPAGRPSKSLSEVRCELYTASNCL